MTTLSAVPTDAVALVHSLNSCDIRQRIKQLNAEMQALRVLLRTAVAREQAERHCQQPARQSQEVRQ